MLAATCLQQAATTPEHKVIAREVPLSPMLTVESRENEFCAG